jgi:phage gp46-like protein
MSDITTELIRSVNEGVPPSFDWLLHAASLKGEDGLQTAIIISLFTDRRANADDVIPDGSNNKRGWWADAFPDIDNDKIGSRLWLLHREKDMQSVVNRAYDYAVEALQWLVEDGVARRVEVQTGWVDKVSGAITETKTDQSRNGVLGIGVIVYRNNGTVEKFRFDDFWNNKTTNTSSSSSVLLPVMDNMAAWFRKGFGYHVDENKKVSQWDDYSGHGRHLTQADVDKQPTLIGNKRLSFDGVNDYMNTIDFDLIQPTTVYFRGSQRGWINNYRFYDGTNLNSGTLYQSVSQPLVNAYAGMAIGSNQILDLNVTSNIVVVFNKENCLFQIDNRSPVVGNAGNRDMGGIVLGNSADHTKPGEIEAEEIIIFSDAHNEQEIAQTMSYLDSI